MLVGIAGTELLVLLCQECSCLYIAALPSQNKSAVVGLLNEAYQQVGLSVYEVAIFQKHPYYTRRAAREETNLVGYSGLQTQQYNAEGTGRRVKYP